MPTKRRKKRKRRQKSKQDNDAVAEQDSPSVNSEFVKLDEPLPLPKCLQKGEENDSFLMLNGNNIWLILTTLYTIYTV